MSDNATLLLALLRPHLRLVPPNAPIQMDDDLGKLGLDSMASIDVLMQVESEFDVSIPEEMVTVEMLATPRNLLRTIEAQKAMDAGGM